MLHRLMAVGSGQLYFPRWVVLGMVGVLIASAITVLLGVHHRNDLDIFLAASNDLLHGRNVYRISYFDGYHYFYSGTFAILLSPMALLPTALAKLVWGLCLVIATARCTWLVLTHWLPESMSPSQRGAALLIANVVLFQSLRDNINAGQVTPLVLWFALEGVTQLGSGAIVRGALLIAMGLDLKLLPLVLLPWMVYRAHWRALAICLLATVALQLLPMLVVGWQPGMDMLVARWELLRPTQLKHVLDEEEPSFIALSSMLTAFFSTEGHNPHTLSLPRLVRALSPSALATCLLVGRLVLMATALWFLRWRTMFRRTDALNTFWEIAYLMLCIILLFPHQRYYSVLMALPAVLWLCAYTAMDIPHRARGAWLLLCLLVFTGLSCDLFFGEYAAIFKHYKVISFSILLLMGMLAWCIPQRMHASTGT